MGISYTGNYGIGYKVTEGDGLIDSSAYTDCDDDLNEYLYKNIDGDKFELFEVGCHDEPKDVYVCVSDPFEYGLDLTTKKANLDAELKRLKVEPCDGCNFDEVGGLYIS